MHLLLILSININETVTNSNVLNMLSSLAIPIFSTLGVGGVLVTFINHILTKRRKITDADLDRFALYKSIYFTAAYDPHYNPKSIEESKILFHHLFAKSLHSNEHSLLLSKNLIVILKKFQEDPSPYNIRRVRKRIKREFNSLRKKHNFHISNLWDIIRLLFVYVVAITSILQFLLSLFVVIVIWYDFGFSYIFHEDVIGYTIALLICIILPMCSFLYLKENMYVFTL